MAEEAIISIRGTEWQVLLTGLRQELRHRRGTPDLTSGEGMLLDVGSPQIIQVRSLAQAEPLDIAFLSEGLVLVEVYRKVPGGEILNSTLPVRYVLQVNAGELIGIDSGDRASLERLPA
ncbi:MAG: DUF192 domain-containing protein [Chloroflexota bacterium]